jgi:uncharacterized protein DUF1844
MPMSETDFPLPPPTFEFLIFSLKMQAEMRMGLLPTGEAEDKEPDLPTARHAIDMLAMLADKTRGNLSMEEQRLIENSLTELRFRYVQVTEIAAKLKAEAAQASEGSASTKQDETPASS